MQNKHNSVVCDEQYFRYIWKLLCHVWRENSHCFRHGCGRETLADWVVHTCHVRLPPRFYRAVLEEAVRRGWAEKSTTLSGYSAFNLKI